VYNNIIGNPLPNITWYKNGVTPPQRQSGSKITYIQWAIILDNLTTEDSGIYMCKVINENGFLNFTYKVVVAGKHRYNYH